MKSRQFQEFIFFQFITVTVDLLDQYSIFDCDLVFEKRNFIGMDLLLVIVFSS